MARMTKVATAGASFAAIGFLAWHHHRAELSTPVTPAHWIAQPDASIADYVTWSRSGHELTGTVTIATETSCLTLDAAGTVNGSWVSLVTSDDLGTPGPNFYGRVSRTTLVLAEQHRKVPATAFRPGSRSAFATIESSFGLASCGPSSTPGP